MRPCRSHVYRPDWYTDVRAELNLDLRSPIRLPVRDERMRAHTVGRGTEPGSLLGPLVDDATRAKVHELVKVVPGRLVLPRLHPSPGIFVGGHPRMGGCKSLRNNR